jgi:hypothetical protein
VNLRLKPSSICDAGKLLTIAQETGEILHAADISGPADVIFFNPVMKHVYVAIRGQGVIDVFDTTTLAKVETTQTEKGTHSGL